ncbi:hypothetical protein PM082_011126 [Marasmius tenuissimus]|nr:hypothetical protein PM082_011126 [Marasmius tenuissimus]
MAAGAWIESEELCCFDLYTGPICLYTFTAVVVALFAHFAYVSTNSLSIASSLAQVHTILNSSHFDTLLSVKAQESEEFKPQIDLYRFHSKLNVVMTTLTTGR